MKHSNLLLTFAAAASALLLSAWSLCAQPEIHSQWEGARVAFLGDSITETRQLDRYNNVYWNYLQNILGVESYVYGISGHQMSQIVGQAEKLEAEHGQEVDAILVMIGTNDYNNNIPLGEWYTYSKKMTNHDGVAVERTYRELIYDNSTFRGRANIAMRWLKSHYPDKQIIFLTPLHRGVANFNATNIQPVESYCNGAGSFIEEYVQAVKELGTVWAVPVIDLCSISGLYPMLDEHTRYFRNPDIDRLHPNAAGHLRMAYAIAYQLLGYPAVFPKYIGLAVDGAEGLDALEKSGVRASILSSGKLGSKAAKRAEALGCEVAEPEGYSSVAVRSWEASVPAAERAREIIAGAKDGDLLRISGSDAASLEALQTAVPELQKRGFSFVSLSELYGSARSAAPKAAEGKTITNVY